MTIKLLSNSNASLICKRTLWFTKLIQITWLVLLGLFISACTQDDSQDDNAKKPEQVKPSMAKQQNVDLSPTDSVSKNSNNSRHEKKATNESRFFDAQSIKDIMERRKEERKRTPKNTLSTARIEEIKKKQEIRASKLEAYHEKALIDITSEDDALRKDAIGYLDVDNLNEVKMLTDLMLNDQDANIRKEAAESFLFGDASNAIPELISALSDTDAEVVIIAINALSWDDDYIDIDVINGLKPLLDHPDTQVREDAKDALDNIDDDAANE